MVCAEGMIGWWCEVRIKGGRGVLAEGGLCELYGCCDLGRDRRSGRGEERTMARWDIKLSCASRGKVDWRFWFVWIFEAKFRFRIIGFGVNGGKPVVEAWRCRILEEPKRLLFENLSRA